MSIEHVNYFHNDTCLFCGDKAKEIFDGRDSYNTCECVGRNTWLKAKDALVVSELTPRTRLKTLVLEIEVKRQRYTLETCTKNLEIEQERLKCLLSNKN